MESDLGFLERRYINVSYYHYYYYETQVGANQVGANENELIYEEKQKEQAICLRELKLEEPHIKSLQHGVPREFDLA